MVDVGDKPVTSREALARAEILMSAAALRQIRSGAVAYEMCSPLRGGGSIESLDACARRFVEYMSGLSAAA